MMKSSPGPGVFLFSCIFVVVLAQISSAQSGSPLLFKCVDWDCEEWISRGKTLLVYMGRTDKHLSFKKNQEIFIVGKPVDENSQDWVGKIGDKIGLVPKDYVREDKMGKNPAKFTVGLNEIAGWSMNKDKVELEDQDDELDGENEVGIEDIGDSDDDDSVEALSEPESQKQKREDKVPIPESQQPNDAATQNFGDNLQEPVAQPDSNAFQQQQESSSSNQVEPEVRISSGTVEDYVTPKEDEIASDPVLESISLQPSTDTVLQGTTTIDYLPETPKTDVQKPTDDVTPRIPETVVLDSIASIRNTILGDTMTNFVDSLSVTRVEKSSVEEETFFGEQVEEKTADVAESTVRSEVRMESEVNFEDMNVSPRKVETVEPETLQVDSPTSAPETSSEIPNQETDSSTPMPPTSQSSPDTQEGSMDDIPAEPAPESESTDTLSLSSDSDTVAESKQSGESQMPDEFATTEKNVEMEQPLSPDSISEEFTDSASSPQSDVVSPEIASPEESKPSEEVVSDIPNQGDNELTDQIKHEEISSPPEENISSPSGEDISSQTEKEISSPLEEDASVPQVEDASVPQVEDASVPQVEDISLSRVDDVSSQVNEVTSPQVEDTSPQQGEAEDISSSQVEEISPPQEETLSPPEEEIPSPTEKEISPPTEEEVSVPQVEDISSPQIDDVSSQVNQVSLSQEDEISPQQGEGEVEDISSPQVKVISPPQEEEVSELPQVIEEGTTTTESPPLESQSPFEMADDDKSPTQDILTEIEQSVSSNDTKQDEEKQEPEALTDYGSPVSIDNPNIPSVLLDFQESKFPVIMDEVPQSFASAEHSPTVEIVERREPEVIPDIPVETSPEKEEASEEEPILSVPSTSPPISPVDEEKVEENSNDVPQEAIEEDSHATHNEAHADHHHHHHHHRHNLFKDSNDTETSSLILVVKHISSTLLSFLPEPLQDTILDVDDALVLTGIIALTLVSICVPYFLIEAHLSLRPLKKKVVELNKSLWKVSAAYETQQEEFEIFKQKAIAHDEFKKRAEQSENDLSILKKLETKHREQITTLKNQLKSQMKEAVDIRALIEKTLEGKKVVAEECEKYKAAYESTKEALHNAKDELSSIQTQAKSSSLLLSVSGKNVEVLNSKISMLEQETEEMKSQLVAENEKRKAVAVEKYEIEQAKVVVEKELTEFKNICHQYESTVSDLNDEISKLESELASIKETLGEDSPLLEVAEIQAKVAFSERETESLRTRLSGLTADNDNLSGKVKEMSSSLEDARNETEKTNNRLQVLEKYFKEREEEYIKTIEQLQLKESVRDKGKEELIKIIEEKDSVCKDLDERLEALKDEFEETKQQHRNEIRTLEAKGHENWLSLCQAERKAQDARKEAQQLRQRLTALSKEGNDEDGDGLNGEVPMYPVLPDELVPLPIFDEPPSYFGLGGDFVPPPPLPEGGEIEPHRPPPLGGRLSPSFSDFDDNVLSPIGVGRRDEDCTDGSSGSNSPRRSPPLRGGWVNVPHDLEGQGRGSIRQLSRATSSPIQRGANL